MMADKSFYWLKETGTRHLATFLSSCIRQLGGRQASRFTVARPLYNEGLFARLQNVAYHKQQPIGGTVYDGVKNTKNGHFTNGVRLC
ncbi:hypothetical protein TNCV_2360161 [Trichonephila clavipes]|nr:hypothetical protein TNCV_2360161 [Trichonephila clavipes]